jgi:hypothetical protein
METGKNRAGIYEKFRLWVADLTYVATRDSFLAAGV